MVLREHPFSKYGEKLENSTPSPLQICTHMHFTDPFPCVHTFPSLTLPTFFQKEGPNPFSQNGLGKRNSVTSNVHCYFADRSIHYVCKLTVVFLIQHKTTIKLSAL